MQTDSVTNLHSMFHWKWSYNNEFHCIEPNQRNFRTADPLRISRQVNGSAWVTTNMTCTVVGAGKQFSDSFLAVAVQSFYKAVHWPLQQLFLQKSRIILYLGRKLLLTETHANSVFFNGWPKTIFGVFHLLWSAPFLTDSRKNFLVYLCAVNCSVQNDA